MTDSEKLDRILALCQSLVPKVDLNIRKLEALEANLDLVAAQVKANGSAIAGAQGQLDGLGCQSLRACAGE